MYGELIMDAVPEKVRVFVIMQMYLTRDWEGRVKHWIFQMQTQDLAQWCSEWFHYNLWLFAAQIFFLFCAKIEFSLLLLMFRELNGLALQVVCVVAWCYWGTCRRQAPCFHPSRSPFLLEVSVSSLSASKVLYPCPCSPVWCFSWNFWWRWISAEMTNHEW